jgi:hypothetical protein
MVDRVVLEPTILRLKVTDWDGGTNLNHTWILASALRSYARTKGSRSNRLRYVSPQLQSHCYSSGDSFSVSFPSSA